MICWGCETRGRGDSLLCKVTRSERVPMINLSNGNGGLFLIFNKNLLSSDCVENETGEGTYTVKNYWMDSRKVSCQPGVPLRRGLLSGGVSKTFFLSLL